MNIVLQNISVSKLKPEVDKKVKNELLKVRIERPFSSSTLNNLKIAPIAIIPNSPVEITQNKILVGILCFETFINLIWVS